MTKADVVRVSELDWPALGEELDRWGFAVTPPLLDEEQCRELSDLFEVDEAFRSTIVMSRHAFGEGTYRYFADPLPAVVQQPPGRALRAAGEDRQRWAAQLGTDVVPRHARRPRRGVRGGGAAPADAAAAALLGRRVQLPAPGPLRRGRVPAAGHDHAERAGRGLHRGRERPRGAATACSSPVRWWRASSAGQALLFPTRDRPVPGKRGPKRVAMRHGVSTVHTGERTTLGIIFHNAE